MQKNIHFTYMPTFVDNILFQYYTRLTWVWNMNDWYQQLDEPKNEQNNKHRNDANWERRDVSKRHLRAGEM